LIVFHFPFFATAAACAFVLTNFPRVGFLSSYLFFASYIFSSLRREVPSFSVARFGPIVLLSPFMAFFLKGFSGLFSLT